MDKTEVIEAISKHITFLSAACQAELVSVSSIVSVPKNTILVKEGQFSNKAFFIVQGGARSYYLKDGKDVTDWFAFENEFIAAIKSYFQVVPSPNYLETLEHTVLLVLSKENSEKVSNSFNEFEKLQRMVVTQTMLKLQERVESIQFQTAEQKYDYLLSTCPGITQRVPLTHIASYLGITLETLSRIRKIKSRI